MGTQNEVYFLNYTLNWDDYVLFQKVVSDDKYQSARKHCVLLGMVGLLVALLSLGLAALTRRISIPLLITQCLLILFALLYLLFFPVFFKKYFNHQMARNYFDKDDKVAGRIYKYQVSGKGILERMSYSDGFLAKEHVVSWLSVRRIYIYDDGIVLLTQPELGVFLPSRISKKEIDRDLKAFIIKKAEEMDITVVYQI